MATKSLPRQHHALAVPLPAQGHTTPLMRFCKLLASRPGFLITFVNVDPIHDRLQQARQLPAVSSSRSATGQPLCTINLIHVPLPAFDLSEDYRRPADQFFEIQKGIARSLEELIGSLSPPPTCIISDVCMSSVVQPIAEGTGIPCVMFVPFGIGSLLFGLYLGQGALSIDELVAMAQDRKACWERAYEADLEGLVSLRKKDLPHFTRGPDEATYMYHFVAREVKMACERGHALVANTFMELEGDAIKAYGSHISKIPLYPIGPLIEDLTNECNTSLWQEDRTCIAWLEKQRPKSILYISFGSVAFFSKEQMEVILCGLKSSNQRFLWAFRPGLVEGSMLSILEEFVQCTCDRGYVVSWAPQLSILQHPSVCAFLTHCGWNSIIESIASGVPMLCWPYYSDQFINARYITEEWKVGLALQSSCEESHVISSVELETGIRAIMEGDEGKVVRDNVARLKEYASSNDGACLASKMSINALIQSLP